MWKVVSIIVAFFEVFCCADMICIENKTGEVLRIEMEIGEYQIQICEIDCMLANCKDLPSNPLMLKNDEQLLLKTQHQFKTKDGINKPCGFFINALKSMINIVKYDFEKGQFGDFTVENITNYADNPLPGEALFSDRLYRITKTTSEQISPQKSKIQTKTKAYSEDCDF